MIAPEGKVILIPLLLLVIAGAGLNTWQSFPALKWINLTLALLTLFSLYFFRDPQRPPLKEKGLLSPADGKIVQIIEVEDTEMGKAKQISIFLSVFNVHSQRVPETGKVIWKKYHPGKFLAAFNHKASLNNEQTEVLFETKDGERYKIKQIAGLIARRILNYMEVDNPVERGDRLGFIRFGSRVDIIIPHDFKIAVSLGDVVKGNQHIIGSFHED
ncbi:MAG: phosphatidylserine decarboxylase [Candidatus Marinimicrobia bacterium]|nr:phosphatidylserine decarboxylase [Candidatus Neomarinimicrobiota bacterium]MDP6853376.1 phosphatidylserine decarboxylase [Candidatus Neomarinimicrobiota bacterium]